MIKTTIGSTYGKLTIINEKEPIIYTNGQKVRRVDCSCSCGNEKIVRLSDLRSGKTNSCGCYHKEIMSHIMKTVNKKHGDRTSYTSTAEYRSWYSMKDRCYRKKNKRYSDYGGRGITVCERWLHSFESFIEDMGRKPFLNYSLDRIDNNLGYNKENCRWTTSKIQNNNKRTTKVNIC